MAAEADASGNHAGRRHVADTQLKEHACMLRILRSLIVFAQELALVDAAAAAVRRTATYVALGLFVLLLTLASASCGAASLWIWADGRFGHVTAPLVVAGALLAVALVLIGAMAIMQRRVKRARAAKTARAVEDIALAPGRLMSMAAEGFLAGLASRGNKPV